MSEGQERDESTSVESDSPAVRAARYVGEVERVVRTVGEHPLYELKRSCELSDLFQGAYTTTHIIGYLSDDPQRTQLHMECDAGIFSRGPDGKANTYAARYSGKSHQIKIQTREMGTDKIREHTCKY